MLAVIGKTKLREMEREKVERGDLQIHRKASTLVLQ
jgi:hypothetical protein